MVSSLPTWSPHCRHGLLASVKGLPVVAGTSSLQSGSPCCRRVIHAAAMSSAPSYRGRPHPRLSTAAARHERTVHIRLFLLHNFPRTLLSVRTLSNRQMCATPSHWFSSSHLMVSTCGTLNPPGILSLGMDCRKVAKPTHCESMPTLFGCSCTAIVWRIRGTNLLLY